MKLCRPDSHRELDFIKLLHTVFVFKKIVCAHYEEKLCMVVKPFLISGEDSMCSPKRLNVNKATAHLKDVTRSNALIISRM